MYTREGITGSNPVLSANKKDMKKKISLILFFVLWFLLGLLYVSKTRAEEKEEKEEFVTPEDALDFNDSISIDQVRRLDSLHAAGKL